MSAASFPPSLRLRRRSEFRAVQERGRKVHTAHFLVCVLAAEAGPTRLGITASRKVGGAVVRNRVKRYVRETFRQHRTEFPPGKLVVVVVKQAAATIDGPTAREEILRACRRL